MRMNTKTTQIVSTESHEAKKFTVNVNSHMVRTITDKLYTYKHVAVVRELLANALDAHIDAGTDAQVEVTFPTKLTGGVFKVQDFGNGMTHRFVMEVYSSFFSSTKTTTNQQTGAYGLGSKAPFALTDQFTVETATKRDVDMGQVRIYTCAKDDKGMPYVNFMGASRRKDGVTGSCVYFIGDNVRVNGYNMDLFRGEMFREIDGEYANALNKLLPVFMLNDVKILGVSSTDHGATLDRIEGYDGIFVANPDGRPIDNHISSNVFQDPRGKANSWLRASPHHKIDVIMGCGIFTINGDDIREQLGNASSLDLAYISGMFNTTPIVQAPVGTFDVPPSRETIEWTEHTKKGIKVLLNTLAVRAEQATKENFMDVYTFLNICSPNDLSLHRGSFIKQAVMNMFFGTTTTAPADSHSYHELVQEVTGSNDVTKFHGINNHQPEKIIVYRRTKYAAMKHHGQAIWDHVQDKAIALHRGDNKDLKLVVLELDKFTSPEEVLEKALAIFKRNYELCGVDGLAEKIELIDMIANGQQDILDEEAAGIYAEIKAGRGPVIKKARASMVLRTKDVHTVTSRWSTCDWERTDVSGDDAEEWLKRDNMYYYVTSDRSTPVPEKVRTLMGLVSAYLDHDAEASVVAITEHQLATRTKKDEFNWKNLEETVVRIMTTPSLRKQIINDMAYTTILNITYNRYDHNFHNKVVTASKVLKNCTELPAGMKAGATATTRFVKEFADESKEIAVYVQMGYHTPSLHGLNSIGLEADTLAEIKAEIMDRVWSLLCITANAAKQNPFLNVATVAFKGMVEADIDVSLGTPALIRKNNADTI